jgi:transcriptional regulator with XRE-family HTH domain
MKEHQITRSAASSGLVALRKALKLTQAQFAVLELQTAVTTIARYETSHPPQGDLLTRLRDIAKRHQLDDLAQTFEELYAEEAANKIERLTLHMSPPTENAPARGSLCGLVEGRNGLLLAQMVILLDPYLRKGDDRATEALSDLCKAVQEVTKGNPLAIKLAFAAVDAIVSGGGPLQVAMVNVPAPDASPKTTTHKKKRGK